MKMLGHKNVSVHHEAVLAAGFFQKAKENVAAPGRPQMRLAAVATAGYEMQVPGPVVAVQALRHPITLHVRVGTGTVIPEHCAGDEAHPHPLLSLGCMAVASACRSYGCTTNTLLLVSVPFVVLTVMGPVVAPSGIVALINVG